MPKRAASRDERAGRGLGAARSTETNTERQFGSAPKKSGRTSRGKRVCAARPSTVQARAAGCGAAAAAGMRTPATAKAKRGPPLPRRLARYQQPSAPPVQTSPPIHRSNSRPRSSYRKLMHARATGVQHHPGLASLMARHAQTLEIVSTHSSAPSRPHLHILHAAPSLVQAAYSTFQPQTVSTDPERYSILQSLPRTPPPPAYSTRQHYLNAMSFASFAPLPAPSSGASSIWARRMITKSVPTSDAEVELNVLSLLLDVPLAALDEHELATSPVALHTPASPWAPGPVSDMGFAHASPLSLEMHAAQTAVKAALDVLEEPSLSRGLRISTAIPAAAGGRGCLTAPLSPALSSPVSPAESDTASTASAAPNTPGPASPPPTSPPSSDESWRASF
ncbi:hypothetical protein PANT_12d00030 [Moesziomyces antarcticus T-34]|uniref:Uncharacterized protein n=1 Tax=Pseudozyma antarctica (strain T-34) TaxID=1151754 RepID=M9M2X5_PSEA3|nr:hypothetical protein PANT_12d00030 [Moesziomyces antarcticus T-34]